MGKPAGRLGDMTTHGGAIVAGFPTVMIGGQPSARLTDMHVCPMQTPAVVPIPHVGGPMMTLGSPTVLIGGMPAVRAMDMAICVGPPDPIILGCPTVLIGEVGSGGGGGGGGAGGGGAAATGASASAAMALSGGEGGGPGTSAEPGHWIKYEFVDSASNPVSGVFFKFTAPDDRESEGRLGAGGVVYWSGPDAGQGNVVLMIVTNAQWSADTAEVGEAVTMSADVEGFEAGTPAIFTVYKRDVSGPDRLVGEIRTETEGSSVQAEWQYEYPENIGEDDGPQPGSGERTGYSAPDFYFLVRVGNQQARSGFLEIHDTLEIELKDPDEEPITDQDYVLQLANGQVRNGAVDQDGSLREENLPPGYYEIRFPDLPDNL